MFLTSECLCFLEKVFAKKATNKVGSFFSFLHKINQKHNRSEETMHDMV